MIATTRIKRVASLRAGGTPSVDDPAMWSESGMPWVAIGDMTRSPIVIATERKVSLVGITDRRLPVGDPGTLLFAMYASVGEVAVLGITACWNQAILGIDPCVGRSDSRFLRYWLEHLRPEFRAITRSNTQDNLNAQQVGDLPFPSLPITDQRAIADYLDRETARIDALIEKKGRILDLLAERQRQLLTAAMGSMGMELPNALDSNWYNQSIPTGWQVMHLNQCLRQLTNGFVGPTRDILRDHGVRYVQSLHIKGGRIDFDRSPFYVSEEWHRERPRVHLREGDVLIVQTGDIGQVAVVPAAFGEASCHALQIARVRPELISGPFLGEYLRTPFAYQSLLKRATGALHPHLEGGIRDVPVVVPPLQLQEVLLQQVRQAASQAEALATLIRSQLQLLAEHRASVVVSAVTGQSRVPGVAA